MSLDVAALRRTYHEQASRIDADPKFGLPAWISDLHSGDLLTRPLVCIANDNLELILDWLDVHANVIGIVDDYHVGTSYGRHQCISSAAMVELSRRNPETILVNSTTAEAAQRHFNLIASQNEIPVLSLLEFHRTLRLVDHIHIPVRPNGLLQTNDILAFFDAALDLESEYCRMEGKLAGLHSKATLFALLLQRLTGDSRWHSDVSVGGYLQPYGPDSYVVNQRFFKLNDEEVFVDAGAYRGDTLKLFSDSVNDRFKMIHAFEPDPANFSYLQSFCKKRFGTETRRVQCHQAGVWEHSGSIRIRTADSEGTSNLASHVESPGTTRSDDCSISVDVVALDDRLADEDVTLIKLEIEGSEVAALRGSRTLLTRRRPKLAVSAYHRARDLIDIIDVVESLDAGYTIDLAHHRQGLATFVYYCAPPR